MLQHIELKNEDGKILRGYFHKPENFTGEINVMFHGFTGNKTEHACHFRNFSRMLEKEGIGALRLDFSGNGESDGIFLDFTFDTMVKEARMIIEYALNELKATKLNIQGFSMGGAIAGMMAKEYVEKVNKVLLWSPCAGIKNTIKRRYEMHPIDENGNSINGVFSMSKEMYESVEKYDVLEGLSVVKQEVFIVQGTKDQAVHFETPLKYKALFDNCDIHYVEGAGHGYDLLSEMNELYEVSLKFILK